MSQIATTLVDAKYGRLFLHPSYTPASATPTLGEVREEEDEPVFILRAQDDLAVHTLARYIGTARQIEDPSKQPDDEWFKSLDAVMQAFIEFRNANPDRVKVPD